MPNVNIAAALREVPNLEQILQETFADFGRISAEYDAEDLDVNTLTELLCEKLESHRTWYKVSGPVVTLDFGQ